MGKDVAVVILNYGHKEQTIECVQSVQKSTYKNLIIIVVDNEQNSGLFLQLQETPNVIFIQNKSNTGYTGGNNLGIKKAISLNVNYIFVLNPDTLIDVNAIKNLVIAANQEGVGIVGPKILFEDKKTIWYAGGFFDKANVLGYHRGLDEVDEGKYDSIDDVDYITGAAMLIKVEVIKKVGLFDEKYFLYYEDSDYCWRVKTSGYKIIYVPKAVIYHKNAQSTGLGSPLQDYFITRNRLLFASKFLSFRTKFALLREAVKNLNNCNRRKALIDFLIGNLGKGSLIR
ncbi:glycosyltransferase family 2 protein [Candidatus Parcubacteria bacterium]|nr:MAG: glycosyltransferase family 2 protein [Candidatus Parcubacteria bacterium]